MKVSLPNVSVVGRGARRDYTELEYLKSRVTGSWLLPTGSEYNNVGSGKIRLDEQGGARE